MALDFSRSGLVCHTKSRSLGFAAGRAVCSCADLHLLSFLQAPVLQEGLQRETVRSQISLGLQDERENHKEWAKKELGTVDPNPGLAARII